MFGEELILGFKEDSSPEEYLDHLKNKTLPSVLQEYYVKKGDVFSMPVIEKIKPSDKLYKIIND